MAATHRSPCLTCGKPSPGAYCAEHQPQYGYDTPLWDRTRDAVLARDGGRCRFRLRGCTDRATSVHRFPQFGTVHDGNLNAYASACAHCHGVIDGRRAKHPTG